MDCPQTKLLFICKRREISYGTDTYGTTTLSSGLLNSARLVVEMLQQNGIRSKLVQVTDNNDIDREVTQYRPTVVIIEALWVIPSKFEVLCRLHPNVTWVIRLHSEIPFLANEGMAFEWLYGYKKFYPNVQIGGNSKRLNKELHHLLDIPILYMPNYYEVDFDYTGHRQEDEDIVNVGCFGAIRPLKNQLIQAVAAIRFADSIDKTLRFHINSNRVECKGEPIQRNLQDLFVNTEHELVEVPWLDHPEFIEYIKENIDLGLQVSFTETFNIVAADLVNCNIPLVVSDEVGWSFPLFQANPTSTHSIVNTLHFVWNMRKLKLQFLNKLGLAINGLKSIETWKALYCQKGRYDEV
jgi:hypothetical protein